MARKKARKAITIVNARTGATYSSIAEAARAEKVDASNLRKVLAGKRNSAGGSTFVSIEKPSSMVREKDIRAIVHWNEERLEESAKRRIETMRKKRQAAEKAARPPKISAETRATRAAAKAAMQSANAAINKLRGKKIGKIALEDLEGIAEEIGATKGGLFSLGTKGSLYNMSDEQLKQATERVNKILRDIERRRETIGREYGLKPSDARTDEWSNALESLIDAFDEMQQLFPNRSGERFSQGGRWRYRDIYDELTVDAQSMTPDQIRALTQSLREWLDSEREKKESELRQIFEKWKTANSPKKERSAEPNAGFKKIKWS